MAWTTEFSADAERDLGLIFDHLFESHIAFGNTPAEAFDMAAARTERIRAAAEGVAGDIAKAPHRGTRREAVAAGLRNLTIDRAVFWFDLNEDSQTVRILAVFHGGQDHMRHMLARLLGG